VTAVTDTGGLDVEYVPDTGPAPASTPVEPAAVQFVATVELRGTPFRVRDEGVSLLALMKFATIGDRAQKNPDGVSEMQAMSALYTLLRSCIHEEEWDAFEDHANQVGAGIEELQRVVADAQQAHAKRPTQLPSGSPGGQPPTAPSSAAGSSPPASSIRQGDVGVQRRLEAQGRPDLALVVQRAREQSTTSSTG
jgi:hypothetical protein